jgi:hypothetical protein
MTESHFELRSRLIEGQSVATTDRPVGHIVFSLEKGAVWASWPGKGASVELGHFESVTYMMRDFLAQCDFGERLAGSNVNDD